MTSLGTEIVIFLIPVFSALLGAVAIRISALTKPIDSGGFGYRMLLLMGAWLAWYLWSLYDRLSGQLGANYLPQFHIQFLMFTLPFVGIPVSYWSAKLLTNFKRSRWWALCLEPVKTLLLILGILIFNLYFYVVGVEFS
ncbi:MAG: hypothetical protein ACFB0Z_01365 [Candidatus Phaeomarinobacter sp.]